VKGHIAVPQCTRATRNAPVPPPSPPAQLTSAFSVFGSKYKWDRRYVVLTPTNLMHFKVGDHKGGGVGVWEVCHMWRGIAATVSSNAGTCRVPRDPPSEARLRATCTWARARTWSWTSRALTCR